MSFVRVRYEIMRQVDGELWFNLPTTGERTQIVAVRQVIGEDGHPWVEITSPVAKAADLDLGDGCSTLAGEAEAGGVISRPTGWCCSGTPSRSTTPRWTASSGRSGWS